jgi:hypothetical protein
MEEGPGQVSRVTATLFSSSFANHSKPTAVTLAATSRSFMTEKDMHLVHDLFCELNQTLVMFDQRTDDKKIIFVTQDEPTMLRHIISSPLTTDAQKEHAKSELDDLIECNDFMSTTQQIPFEEGRLVLYCVPNFGQAE